MKDRNKLIILEYNSFDYPTAQFESVRTQEKLGIYIYRMDRKVFQLSRYYKQRFSDLDDINVQETVQKAMDIYKARDRHSQGKRDILVLEEGIQLKNPMPHIITDQANCSKIRMFLLQLLLISGSISLILWQIMLFRDSILKQLLLAIHCLQEMVCRTGFLQWYRIQSSSQDILFFR